MTPEELCQIEAIKAVKYRYVRFLDTKDWVGIASLFTPDATAAYGGGAYRAEGRDAIVGFLERNMDARSFHSSHRVCHPEIELSGDSARGTWALDDMVLDVELGIMIVGAAFYDDTYVRSPEGWRIASTGYRRVFEYLVPTTDLPGGQLTASWWGTDGASTLPVV